MADRWGSFHALARTAPRGALWVIDQKVEALHSLERQVPAPLAVVRLRAGEAVKSLTTLDRVARAGAALPRSGTLVSVGGGTVGDACTVAAHLLKRGVRLLHVPTTLLAAVDSSVGGKGALNVGGVKNALGVFHEAFESWLCPELFTTLSAGQRREGASEALKMALCLDARVWARWSRALPAERELIEVSRQLKSRVCRQDFHERSGRRALLNFGHTFGHALESLTRFRLRHGEAVELGMLCALDVGRALGVTPERLAVQAEQAFSPRARVRLAAALRRAAVPRLEGLLASDKKRDARGLRMVLVRAPGRASLYPVSQRQWSPLLTAWKRGARP